MNAKILALICSLASPYACEWHTVTTPELGQVRMMGCQVGQPELAEFMRQFPGYRLAKWACQIGERPERSAT
jgi:hypothetical protein